MHLVAAEGEAIGPPSNDPVDAEQCLWVELLRDGLAFDFSGLSPAPAVQTPPVNYSFDLEHSPARLRLEALRLWPGRHLAGGENSPPVLKALLALARDLIHHFDAIEAVIWGPSSSVIGRRFFESTATAWIEGGAFPALGLTAFRETMDGAIQSEGLSFLIGQELRIEPSLVSDKVEATRLGVRLVNQLVIVGGITQSERIVAPDGSRLVLRPSANGKYVRVFHE